MRDLPWGCFAWDYQRHLTAFFPSPPPQPWKRSETCKPDSRPGSLEEDSQNDVGVGEIGMERALTDC